MKKLGEIGFYDVAVDDDGDLCLTPDYGDEDISVCYITIAGVRTLDQFVDELRRVCQNPRERVLAAARRAVESGFCQEDCEALESAVEALADSEDE